MNNDFTITRTNDSDCVRYEAFGRITTAATLELEKALNQAVEDAMPRGGHERRSIFINMNKVTLLTSGGIRVLLKTYKQCENRGGKFRIERPSEAVSSVLGLAALHHMLSRN